MFQWITILLKVLLEDSVSVKRTGAEASAIIHSINETTKSNNLKIYDHFKYLLENIPGHMDDKNLAFFCL